MSNATPSDMLRRALPYLLDQRANHPTDDSVKRLINEVTGYLKMVGEYPRTTGSREELEAAVRAMCEGEFGGFAASLADAWYRADSLNRERIESAFPVLFQRARMLVASRVPA